VSHTLPRDGKLTEYFPQNRGGRFFTELPAATHPPRKNTRFAARKIAWSPLPPVAARLSHRVNVRRGSFSRTGFKRFTLLGISHRVARKSFAAVPRHAVQVLQPATNFGPNETALLAMLLKRLQRCAFSQAFARLRTQLAFGLPQRA
jgi:hypothetical protein